MTDRTSPNLVAVSLFAGLAGALAAMLLAPRSGADTRKKIHDQADDLTERTRDNFHEVKDTVSKGLDKFSSVINKTSAKAKNEYEDLKDRRERLDNEERAMLRTWEEEA
ncbi:YtxH domain-containing protein [Candidatus Saccharibacteria bacterium]|nr:YtxH domain-containing protein [Candidatus Saccharibacteria bacterium]